MLSTGSESLDQFRHLAAKGRARGASTSEVRAREWCLATVKLLWTSDQATWDGVREFLVDFAEHPEAVERWIVANCGPVRWDR